MGGCASAPAGTEGGGADSPGAASTKSPGGPQAPQSVAGPSGTVLSNGNGHSASAGVAGDGGGAGASTPATPATPAAAAASPIGSDGGVSNPSVGSAGGISPGNKTAAGASGARGTTFVRAPHSATSWACLSCSGPEEPINPHVIDLSHFEQLKVVGKGGFGKVNATMRRQDGALMALKRMAKCEVIKKESHVRMVWTERNIMAKLSDSPTGVPPCPFLVNLEHAFQNERELFLVMPFMQGGDLRFHLTKRGLMSEHEARFYSAELVLALEHLHANKIIYRDLKPDNILLDSDGHVRITDFGLAYQLEEKNRYMMKGNAGTAGYLAPEVWANEFYGVSADVWSFGITLYELLHGRRPYRRWNPSKNVIDKLKYLPSLSPAARSFIKGLLTVDPRRRLACGPAGWSEVKSHPFFAKVDWVALQHKACRPPIKPDLKQANCSNQADLADQLVDKKPQPISDAYQRYFTGFDCNVDLEAWQAKNALRVQEEKRRADDMARWKEEHRRRRREARALAYSSMVGSGTMMSRDYSSNMMSSVYPAPGSAGIPADRGGSYGIPSIAVAAQLQLHQQHYQFQHRQLPPHHPRSGYATPGAGFPPASPKAEESQGGSSGGDRDKERPLGESVLLTPGGYTPAAAAAATGAGASPPCYGLPFSPPGLLGGGLGPAALANMNVPPRGSGGSAGGSTAGGSGHNSGIRGGNSSGNSRERGGGLDRLPSGSVGAMGLGMHVGNGIMFTNHSEHNDSNVASHLSNNASALPSHAHMLAEYLQPSRYGASTRPKLLGAGLGGGVSHPVVHTPSRSIGSASALFGTNVNASGSGGGAAGSGGLASFASSSPRFNDLHLYQQPPHHMHHPSFPYASQPASPRNGLGATDATFAASPAQQDNGAIDPAQIHATLAPVADPVAAPGPAGTWGAAPLNGGEQGAAALPDQYAEDNVSHSSAGGSASDASHTTTSASGNFSSGMLSAQSHALTAPSRLQSAPVPTGFATGTNTNDEPFTPQQRAQMTLMLSAQLAQSSAAAGQLQGQDQGNTLLAALEAQHQLQYSQQLHVSELDKQLLSSSPQQAAATPPMVPTGEMRMSAEAELALREHREVQRRERAEAKRRALEQKPHHSALRQALLQAVNANTLPGANDSTASQRSQSDPASAQPMGVESQQHQQPIQQSQLQRLQQQLQQQQQQLQAAGVRGAGAGGPWMVQGPSEPLPAQDVPEGAHPSPRSADAALPSSMAGAPCASPHVTVTGIVAGDEDAAAAAAAAARSFAMQAVAYSPSIASAPVPLRAPMSSASEGDASPSPSMDVEEEEDEGLLSVRSTSGSGSSHHHLDGVALPGGGGTGAVVFHAPRSATSSRGSPATPAAAVSGATVAAAAGSQSLPAPAFASLSPGGVRRIHVSVRAADGTSARPSVSSSFVGSAPSFSASSSVPVSMLTPSSFFELAPPMRSSAAVAPVTPATPPVGGGKEALTAATVHATSFALPPNVLDHWAVLRARILRAQVRSASRGRKLVVALFLNDAALLPATVTASSSPGAMARLSTDMAATLSALLVHSPLAILSGRSLVDAQTLLADVLSSDATPLHLAARGGQEVMLEGLKADHSSEALEGAPVHQLRAESSFGPESLMAQASAFGAEVGTSSTGSFVRKGATVDFLLRHVLYRDQRVVLQCEQTVRGTGGLVLLRVLPASSPRSAARSCELDVLPVYCGVAEDLADEEAFALLRPLQYGDREAEDDAAAVGLPALSIVVTDTGCTPTETSSPARPSTAAHFSLRGAAQVLSFLQALLSVQGREEETSPASA